MKIKETNREFEGLLRQSKIFIVSVNDIKSVLSYEKLLLGKAPTEKAYSNGFVINVKDITSTYDDGGMTDMKAWSVNKVARMLKKHGFIKRLNMYGVPLIGNLHNVSSALNLILKITPSATIDQKIRVKIKSVNDSLFYESYNDLLVKFKDIMHNILMLRTKTRFRSSDDKKYYLVSISTLDNIILWTGKKNM